jgi:hypothetical protein
VIFFFSNFLTLHGCLASQEGFSIKWWQVSRTCLHCINSFVKVMLPNQKSELKCGRINFNYFSKEFGNFFQKNGEYFNRTFPFYFLFWHFGEMWHPKKKKKTIALS